MSTRLTDILTHLDQTRQQLKRVLDRLQPTDWEMPVQDEDRRWTVREIVAHLVSAQKGMTTQIERIKVGAETVPPDFDVSRYNQRSVEKSADKLPSELLTALDTDRAALKQTLNALQDPDFDKRGRHANLSIMSIEEFALMIGTHEADHAQIIAQKLGF